MAFATIAVLLLGGHTTEAALQVIGSGFGRTGGKGCCSY
jgi:hypothetical protein